jgi:nitroreductase
MTTPDIEARIKFDAIDVPKTDVNVYQALYGRRMAWKFKDQKVDRAAVERMLESAVWAPNHRMTEPWRFFVLDKDGQARKKAADLAYDFALERSGNERRAEGTRGLVASPPVVMYVYYIPGPSDDATKENYASVCCAVQNMSLAGVAEGLAVTWETGGATRHPKLAETLGAEEDWLMAGMLSVGVSDEEADSRRTPASNFVNWLS